MKVLFLICIIVRALFIWLASRYEDYSDTPLWIILPIITGLIGIGFIIRKNNIGFFGEKVYWNRYFHGFMYLLFTILWISKIKYSYIVLIIDLLIGILTFLKNISF